MQRDLPELLELLAAAKPKLCMADWRNACGRHFDAISPLLMKDVGEVSWSYPTEAPAIRYTVGIRMDRFMGFVHDDYEVVGIEDRWFEVEDLQLWSLDPDKAAAFNGPMPGPQVENKPVARVSGDFAAITLPSGRYMTLGKKHKRRAFLRAVAAYGRENDTDIFNAERVIEDYNATLPDHKQKRAISTPRVMADLFKGQKAEFMELFEPLDQTAGRFRLKVTFETE